MELEIGDSDKNEIEIVEKPHYELENVVCFENDTKTPGKNVKLICETETKVWSYQEIIMHSISTSTANDFPPCIYCHLNSEEIAELRFVPPNGDVSYLLPMFEALSEGAALNPDERNSEDSDEDLDITGASLPDIFFKLGDAGQIEVYDDGGSQDGEDGEENGDENFEGEENEENFEDAETDKK